MSQDNQSQISKAQRPKKQCWICGHMVAQNHLKDHFKVQHEGEEIRELKEGESVREPNFQLKTGKFVSGDDEARRNQLGRPKKNLKPDIEAISAANHVNKRQKIDYESSYD